jgi:hypothetical protein
MTFVVNILLLAGLIALGMGLTNFDGKSGTPASGNASVSQSASQSGNPPTAQGLGTQTPTASVQAPSAPVQSTVRSRRYEEEQEFGDN